MITLYDLTKKSPQTTWSPNPFKTRFSLNYKKLPYKIVNLEYLELEPEFKKVGIPASSTWADGRPLYSSPSIFDDSNYTGVADSYQIAQYLDQAYPDTPKLFPPGTQALQAAFYARFNELLGPFFPFLLPKVPGLLNPESAEYFNRTRAEKFGKSLADLEPKGQERVEAWKKVEEAYNTLYGWLSQSKGPYFMGDTVTFADFAVGGMIYATEVCIGKDSKEFKDLMTWNNGRWAEFKKSLEQYA
ncbi:hypothetical protein AGABI1DRAFT_115916 [Agaricus bisporus var. burnettii JB137-S8]|uniref:GST N-terminal domain-containing protein n=2 Tax=Agaricus bisporus var. burnettii TaxID=192524 RepID=K5WZT7_AGABU|nr:uncharacterized protein AGABI1DRAFT_115916 [Agaricus bisporus var. burnettii JB137-S8]EKM76373.1 hypothetical protein AGABI1DRAFT_115916 [Agaricus bisporus var. burnettii JB137-S8]KAF7760744.1 hypothetical protein Agabi119p4_10153 [Agaricus bisporus var. burnettii]